MAIIIKNLDKPDEALDGDAGIGLHHRRRLDGLSASSCSRAGAGTNTSKPFTDGDESRQMVHREYVISGRIRYLTDDGDETVAGPGDHLWIGPGHRAWAVGDEPFVAIDFEMGEPEDDEADEESPRGGQPPRRRRTSTSYSGK